MKNAGRKIDIYGNFTPAIKLVTNKFHELALVGLDIYRWWGSIPNIDEANNKFYDLRFGYEDVITIPTGCYEIESINNLLKIRSETWGRIIKTS